MREQIAKLAEQVDPQSEPENRRKKWRVIKGGLAATVGALAGVWAWKRLVLAGTATATAATMAFGAYTVMNKGDPGPVTLPDPSPTRTIVTRTPGAPSRPPPLESDEPRAEPEQTPRGDPGPPDREHTPSPTAEPSPTISASVTVSADPTLSPAPTLHAGVCIDADLIVVGVKICLPDRK